MQDSLEKYAFRPKRKAFIPSEEFNVVQIRRNYIGGARAKLERFTAVCGIPETAASTNCPCLVVVLEQGKNIRKRRIIRGPEQKGNQPHYRVPFDIATQALKQWK